MNSFFLKILFIILISLYIVVYASRVSSERVENLENNTTSNNSKIQVIIKDFYNFRNWLITNIIPHKDILNIRKTTENYIKKSIDELVSNLTILASEKLMSGGYINKECNLFLLSVSVDGIMHTINKLNNCDEGVCTENDSKNIIDILKIKIEYQETFLAKCNESGVSWARETH